jgi:hypothetical protein
MNRFSLGLWRIGDQIYRRVRRFEYQDLQGKNVFRIRVRHYAGPELALPEGVRIRGGDWVGFLHFYNLRLQELLQGVRSENRRVLLVMREVKNSLPELADFVRHHPHGERIKALIGVTLLNRGVEPLGFSVAEVPDTAWFRFRSWYMRWMMAFCHPDGKKRLTVRGQPLRLMQVMLSRDELLRRYGN